MAVYREMDVGTAKPTPAERGGVPHHCIDLADPADDFDLSRFQAAARAAIADVEARGRRALLVGGTGLYVQAVVDDLELPGRFPTARAALDADERATEDLHAWLASLDPLAASRMEPSNRRRVVRALEVTIGSGRPFSSYGPGIDAFPPRPGFDQVGVDLDRAAGAALIRARVQRMAAAGLVDEVRALLSRPRGLSRTARQALGYKEVIAHLVDGRPLEDCLEDVAVRTIHLARRQRAWFRRDPRITWLEAGDLDALRRRWLR